MGNYLEEAFSADLLSTAFGAIECRVSQKANRTLLQLQVKSNQDFPAVLLRPRLLFSCQIPLVYAGRAS